ncbi:hypothetical protein [uncultured Chryseobacterium sp.]|uniref:hypothetical protein n=1 Tax=uncultured Chryseobacterium sp. TaxID=259322 RepID=UPI0025E26867|nr:hypothetical protein [uncultured Chryseobacterium sp.]
MKYKIGFSKKSTDICDVSGLAIYKTIRKTYFFRRKYYVYDQNDNLLLVFQQSDILLFFTKTEILVNNLGENFEYRTKGLMYILNIGRDEISFNGKIAGYLKSEFKVNGKTVGFINEEYQFPNNLMTITFLKSDVKNKFCLILFIIATVNYWDTN